MRAHYFVGTELIGSCDAIWWSLASGPVWYSQALLCPHCGDLWARLIVEPGQDWQATLRGCPRHSWLDHAPGSLLPPWGVPLDTVPYNVLRREFLLTLNYRISKNGKSPL